MDKNLFAKNIPDDVDELMKTYKQTGDKKIRNRLVLAYMHLVQYGAVSTRNIYQKYTETDDIINEATIALMNAIDNYDPEKNTQFQTYASIRIRGAIIDYIRKQDIIPRTVRRFARDYDEAYNRLFEKLDREPTNEELASEMGISVEKLDANMVKTASASTLSFEEMVFDNGIEPVTDTEDSSSGWTPEHRLMKTELRDVIAKAVDELKPKERTVISLYYYEKLKYSDIAQVLEVTESRVCQIHTSAVNHLKQILGDYLH